MAEDDPPKTNPKLTFHLIKTASYETHHADGVLCALNPNGDAFLGFFVERQPIPQSITHELKPDGSLGDVVSARGKDGLVREVQTGIILDVGSVRLLRSQLDRLLQQTEGAEDAS